MRLAISQTVPSRLGQHVLDLGTGQYDWQVLRLLGALNALDPRQTLLQHFAIEEQYGVQRLILS